MAEHGPLETELFSLGDCVVSKLIEEDTNQLIPTIPGAILTDSRAVCIRCIIPCAVLIALLVLALSFSAVDGQFPRACTTAWALRSKICCPSWKGSPCGEHAGRGECPIKHINTYSQVSQALHGDNYGDNQCNDDRMDWPTRYYKYYCRCKGNYTGYNCGGCKYGHYGEKCDVKKVRVRKEIRTLNVTERERLLQYLTLSKSTTSKDFVILVTSDRFDPKAFRFQDTSIYDLYVWIHHYSMKPIDLNCSYTWNRNFAHQGPAFPTWHRMLLLFLERQIQVLTGDEDFAFPFYDWSRDETCTICSEEYLGKNDYEGNILDKSIFSSWGTICGDSDFPNTYCQSASTDTNRTSLRRSPGTTQSSSLPTQQDVLNVVRWKDYDNPPYDRTALYSFRNAMEGFLDPSDGETYGSYVHNRVHNYMGGTMADISISANDPMFIVHHCFVDFIFELWIRRHNGRPEDFPESSLPGQRPLEFIVPFYPQLQNRDLLQTSSVFGYTFQEIPGYVSWSPDRPYQ
ncbi:tyrosinase-like [Hyla sarda]|uniref:tyrosinase-like n=1 Tax=Hyla sarda TaxID=327740 RepID=UPI0024C357AF|nr:tyrosinase-like [Hyla sarda]